MDREAKALVRAVLGYTCRHMCFYRISYLRENHSAPCGFYCRMTHSLITLMMRLCCELATLLFSLYCLFMYCIGVYLCISVYVLATLNVPCSEFTDQIHQSCLITPPPFFSFSYHRSSHLPFLFIFYFLFFFLWQQYR